MAIVTDMYTVVFQLLKMIENVSFISTILRMEAPCQNCRISVGHIHILLMHIFYISAFACAASTTYISS